jgi:bifunctional UDP-N-acetylglucosamine pyrophosphorylase/glucosamine-1-phosphate N-acetyltransferase
VLDTLFSPNKSLILLVEESVFYGEAREMSLTVVMLAGGRGERLWPLTSTRPKPLLPLPGGETLLTRLIRQTRRLAKNYVIVIPEGSAGDKIRDSLRGADLQVKFVKQDKPLGTGHAAQKAMSELPPSSNEVLLVYGDLFVADETIRTLASLEPPAIVGVKSSEPWNYGVLEVDEKGCLHRIIEKPSNAKPGSLINAGIYLLEVQALEEALKKIGVGPRGEIEFTDAVQELAKKTCVKVVEAEGAWVDVGRPWDLFIVYRIVFNESVGNKSVIKGEVSPLASIKGPVYIGPNAVIREYTVIEGPAWIEGEVGPLSRIRPWSFILEGARVGAHTEIKNSILLRGAKAPHFNYVGDSIIGEEVNLGAGTITANLRFDHAIIKIKLKGKLVDTGLKKLGSIMGDYAQTGINVSLLPGTRVGAFSWVYPGLTIGGDIPDCVLAKPGSEGVVLVDISDRVKCNVLSRNKNV